jgi:MYXO-CTERM domain-containing protein
LGRGEGGEGANAGLLLAIAGVAMVAGRRRRQG